MKKKLKLLILLIIVAIISFGFYNRLKITYYEYTDASLPVSFDGFKIVLISDFHSKKLGNEMERLVKNITLYKPDIIVFTGDMIDDKHKNITPVGDLLTNLKGICPMYAVSGNHENDIEESYERLLEYYQSFKVINLDDTSKTIYKNGDHIGIYGLSYRERYFIRNTSRKPNKANNVFNILLYHDATGFSEISSYGYNLVLSGHTHGGVIRLPFIGGLISNDGTLFPEFEGGMYRINNSTLISSRGIGDSYFPRFYNRPEAVFITLRTGKK